VGLVDEDDGARLLVRVGGSSDETDHAGIRWGCSVDNLQPTSQASATALRWAGEWSPVECVSPVLATPDETRREKPPACDRWLPSAPSDGALLFEHETKGTLVSIKELT
jgi:hypothetical protein